MSEALHDEADHRADDIRRARAQERADKLAALTWVCDMTRQRAAVATTEEMPGLRVAIRMMEQQIERFGG